MKRTLLAVCVLFFCVLSTFAQPLRVFIRAGEKTHGPGEHDHPKFLAEWKDLLNERGAKADGALSFPTAEQLDNTDVLVMYCAEGGTVAPEQRGNLDKFLKRGGGIVVIHDAVCGKDAAWFKSVVGGAWEHGHSKYFEGSISLYYQDYDHPITKGVSNFDFDDEMYYDLHLMPEARVLAATYKPDDRNKKDGKLFPSVYDIVPQMWVYEKDNYRAFVSIPGHKHTSFSLPHYRAVLLRGIAWTGKREADSLCSKEELASLRYPAGGPTTPEKSAAGITVESKFNLNLVAAEPLIEKPISHDWDAQGRLWVAETPEYPAGRTRPSGEIENRPGRDRISILEDTNNDGVMDKKKVFADGLELVTSFVFHKDGLVVCQPPDVYFLRDTDKDGKADKKETLYTGFGMRDTHAVASNMRWGQDGWIYATLGYSGGNVKSGDGKKDFGALNSGVIRFRADGSMMEQVSSKNGNTWGLDFTWDNELFFSQANGQHCNHVIMSETILARGRVGKATSYKCIEDHNRIFPIRSYDKQAYVQIDHVGGFTAASGAMIYNGGAWPAEWENNYFVTEPTVNIVHRDILKPEGVTYVASRPSNTEFIGGTDLWFRPIHSRVGPDGAVYVLDFYNQAVVHNDTRGPKHGPANAAVRPDRDHFFGRIWRVQHKEARKLEVPNLSTATPTDLVNALKHPNEWVRMTAHRLLAERGERDVAPALEALAADVQAPSPARVHAIWVLQNLGNIAYGYFSTLVPDTDPAVAKNALRVIAGLRNLDVNHPLHFAVIGQFQNADPRVQMEAVLAISAFKNNKSPQDMLVHVFPKMKNHWSESAALGVAAKDPIEFLESALSVDPTGLDTLVSALIARIASKQEPAAIADVMVRMGIATPAADPLKAIILEKLLKELKPDFMLPWTPALQLFCENLLASQTPEVRLGVLPLVVRWDPGMMIKETKALAEDIMTHVHDGDHPESEQLLMARCLLGVRQLNEGIIPLVARLINTNSVDSQRQVIELLGDIAEPAVAIELINAYSNAVPEVQEFIFNQLLKRAEWAISLLDMIATKKIELASLSPIAVNRLRTHGDKTVAKRAGEVIDIIRGPQTKEKDELIAKYAPVAEEIGNPGFGKTLFTQNCGVCHKFNGEGKDLGPDLTGMGVHGSRELLVHILDPNRIVEPNFTTVSLETKDGESHEGIVGREDKHTILLRNAAGEIEIKKVDIKTRKATGRSLMPEGFESIGPAAVRDIIDYICSVDSKYRVIDLARAATANSTRGIYISPDSLDETLKFKRFGMVKMDDVPFEIANPLTSSSGNNVIVLKGGEGYAKTLPQKVEIDDLNIKAYKLHILGGVAGWGFPWGDKEKNGKLPAVKMSVSYANGRVEEFTLRNGVEFADYNGNVDVPGSKAVPGIVSRGQVRYFALQLGDSKTPVRKITLESFDNVVAPTFVGITAEVEPKRRVVETIEDLGTFYPHSFGPIAVSMLGGGSSHDFENHFNMPDSVAMAYASDSPIDWTTNLSYFEKSFTNHDVIYLCSNQPMTNDAVKKGIFDFANSGKGLLLVHPALWYNWKEWPEYNRELVGGGTSHHDKYGEIEVVITNRKHPIMENIPKSFKVQDELYHFKPDPKGNPIEVLATATNTATGSSFPAVWIVKHPKTRIVCITLGHDMSTHDNVAYKVMLQNAMAWVAHRKGDEKAEPKRAEVK